MDHNEQGFFRMLPHELYSAATRQRLLALFPEQPDPNPVIIPMPVLAVQPMDVAPHTSPAANRGVKRKSDDDEPWQRRSISKQLFDADISAAEHRQSDSN
ncbi:hypothetical protein Dimus_039010 [Dionaea muscipula]